jgi:4-amino-4-deoxy-L-arabinose transferase-like glycosyltransferase
VASVPVCYALVRQLFDRRAATISAFFVAASVPFVYWGQTARAYAPAVFLVSASTLAFVVGLQTARRAVRRALRAPAELISC